MFPLGLPHLRFSFNETAEAQGVMAITPRCDQFPRICNNLSSTDWHIFIQVSDNHDAVI